MIKHRDSVVSTPYSVKSRTSIEKAARHAIGAMIQPLESRRLFAAFPGAAGPAMDASGGRGGDIYHVTNLTDSTTPQPGSLRYGIQNAPSSGRTIVFDVGGTIQLAPNRNGWLEIGKSNITLAGQTAPGAGVTIMGNVTKVTGNNIVIRHLKFRPKLNGTTPDSLTKDALWLTGDNIIVDHVSASWYDDEGISSSDSAGDITVQYAILGEGLNYNGHGYGSIIGSDVPDSQIAYHHILYAHHKSRIPRLGNETSNVTYAEFSNNIIYNWQFSRAGYSGTNDSADQPIVGGQFARANFVGNTFMYGNSTTGVNIFLSGGTNTHIYQSGNEFDTDRDGVTKDGRAVTWADFLGDETQVATRFNIANVSYESADTSFDNTLNNAGAFWWNRDVVDARLVNETRTGTGDVIATANSTEWNNLWNASQVTRAAGWDTDNDGMPNTWESANGLNPSIADNNGDADNDGYRNIEEYLEFAAQGSPADTVAPTSNVAALPVITGSTSFNVSWSGTDNAGGSGIANYDVYVSTNNGAYTLWQNATATTNATFTGVAGSQYKFYSRARDIAGNVEAAPASHDATIRISSALTFMIVAADGTGQYTTVQAAINAVPATNTQPVDIYIKSGTYNEHVSIAAGKSFITLIGQDPATTKITFNTNVNFGGGTFESATVTVYANDFSAENITFENSYGQGVQALAMAAKGARQQFRNSRWLGWQDTLRIDTNQMYFKDCYIEGHVDFIYGDATAVFDNCQIVSKGGGYVTAASTPQTRAYGYVFLGGSLLTSGAGNDTVYLGRPWQPYASVTYINTFMDTHIHPTGWNDWGNAANQATARYAEYNSSGAGASPSTRVAWSSQLTAVQASTYTVPNILPGWTPSYYVPSTADITAPSSSVTVLPATTTTTTFNVAWSGTDNVGGGGIASYDIYVSTNGAAYSLWQSATTATSAAFTGVNGSQYRFYSIARDIAGNVEAAPATQDATTTIQIPALAGWWKMDESSGSTVSDSSGNNQAGTATNGPSWVAGKSGNALNFDGVDDYVSLPTSIVSSSAGSVAMWVKTGTDFTNMAHLLNTSSVANGDGGGSHLELHLNFTTNDQIQFFIEGNSGGGSADLSLISPLTYNDNTWHHVAATWDINGNAVLYVDGAAVATAAHDAGNFIGSAITYLGRPGTSTRYYTGQMDDVRLYNIILNSTEIATLADTTAPTSSVVSLPATTSGSSFNVSWSGSDTGGSGLKDYDVYVSIDGGAYSLWQNATTATSATYTITTGSNFRFYSCARDNAGNVEAAPAAPDAQTQLASNIIITGTSGNDTIRLVRNGASVNVTLNGTTTSFSIASLLGVSISAVLGNDNIIVDYSGGEIELTNGISVNGGTNLDSIEIIGAGSTDNFTINTAGAIVHGSSIATYIGIETIKFTSGNFAVNANLGALNLTAQGISTTVSLFKDQNLSALSITSNAIVNSISSNPAQPGLVAGAVTIDNATLSIAPNGGLAGANKFSSIAISGSGRLDLHDNDLVLDYTAYSSPFDSIFNLVKSGLTLLGGNGYGIGSSEVDAQTLGGSMLAVVDNGAVGGEFTALGDLAVPVNSILIKYTWFGDANLDGQVTGEDYALVDTGFVSDGGLTGWLFGDFSYDGSVNGDDYALIDTGFIAQNVIL